ncbi:MAG: hypothetical protein JXR73_17380 [Candidatus Omnitrophica bacterium]|nr:hypothetical protein [Candidatus Omnitrophota bacterium]
MNVIKNLGIPALPYAIEKTQEGDEDLIEAVNYWTDDALKDSAEKTGVPREQMRQYCLHWWEQNKDDWLLPPVQEAPEP